MIIAPGQQDARNRSRKKNAGAKSSKNKERGMRNHHWSNISKTARLFVAYSTKKAFHTSIKKWVRGTICMLRTFCCDSSFGMMQVLISYPIEHILRPDFFMVHTSALIISLTSARVYACNPSKCRSTSTDAAFRRVLHFWSPKQV